MKKEKFIVKVGNKNYLIMIFICFCICAILCHFSSINNNYYARSIAMGLGIFNFVFFWIYRYLMSIDKEYIEIWYKDYGKMNWYNELPFYPCNIVVLLTPVALYFMNRYLLGYLLIFSLIGPILAILFPTKGFEQYSFLKPRIFGYYLTHIFSMMNVPLFLVGKIIKPEYKDIIHIIIIFMIISFICHILNNYLVKTKKNMISNYFYTMNPESYPILTQAYKLMPIKYFYLWIVSPLLVVIYIIYILIC